MGAEASLSCRFVESAERLPRTEWDRLARVRGADLLRWGLISSFESSGSMVPEKGWYPLHFLIERGGKLVACAPLYLKTHSWGEFVFDMDWAEAAENAGIAWYPKLVGMVPATPVPSWFLLTDPEEDENALIEIFLDAVSALARSEKLGGIHFLWLHPAAKALEGALKRRGWAEWLHQAFLWENRGWSDFPGMLASFSKNMRRNVSRDRDAVAAAGVRSEFVRGTDAPTSVPALMGELYLDTNERYEPWSSRYLETAFFTELAARWPEGTAYSLARGEDGGIEGAALFYVGENRLYGRYWGTRGETDGLHFETCYYRPMEWALASGYRSIDPGMGGDHKARRGFKAVGVPSFHYPLDERVRAAMLRILPGRNGEERRLIEAINVDLPFKRSAAE
jgi:predicted N-acyltransferase